MVKQCPLGDWVNDKLKVFIFLWRKDPFYELGVS